MKKVAIVTGGSKNLGAEISKKLTEDNYIVYAVSRNPEQINSNIRLIKTDIANESECEDLIKKIIKKEKRLDLLVNNAGINSGDVKTDFGVNFFGAYYLINASYKYLKKSKGKIINITSLNALVPTPNAEIYSASKHALEAYSISLSYKANSDNINTTNISPGAIYNPSAKKLSHKTLRDKYKILSILFPMVTKNKVAEKVVEIANSKKPPKRIVMGIDAKIAYFISSRFPNIWFYLINNIYKK